MAQKQRLVGADYEQTIVNKVIDQWSKQAFVKAKGQHFELVLGDSGDANVDSIRQSFDSIHRCYVSRSFIN